MTSLALFGGKPVLTGELPIYNTIDEKEKKAVLEVLDDGELSGFIASPGKEFLGGKRVQLVEQEFREYFGSRYAVSVNSATSGLHVALAATGVGPGDEVIVPPYTMSATATTVLFTGAVPIFADIEDDTFCLEPESVLENITGNTKAIVAVNLFGHPANLRELRKIADEKDIYLIEDNAQAPAAQHHGQYTGTIGHAGVFSFNRHKVIQSGEGGIVICDDEDLAVKMQLVRNHGEVVVDSLGIEDIVNTAGLNYRMTEMEAAVARVQLHKLDSLNEKRIELADYLSDRLAQIPELKPPVVKAGNRHVYYFYPILFDTVEAGISREMFVKAINAEGFILRNGYVKPLYLEPLYQKLVCFGSKGYPFNCNPRYPDLPYASGTCPVVEDLNDNRLMVTSIVHSMSNKNLMDLFADACEKVLQCKDELAGADSH